MLINLRNALTAGRRLPYDAEVEYLESTGTQWIDTGVDIANDIGFSMTFAVTQRSANNSTTAAFCGAGSAWNNGILLLEDFTDSTGLRLNYGGNSQFKSRIRSTVGQIYNITVTANPYTCTISGNSTASGSFTPGNNFSARTKICIFRGPYGSTYTGMNPTGMKCYSFRLWDANGLLVRDFIPVRVGTVGYLYDRVSGKLFGNAGTGDFVLGPDKN